MNRRNFCSSSLVALVAAALPASRRTAGPPARPATLQELEALERELSSVRGGYLTVADAVRPMLPPGVAREMDAFARRCQTEWDAELRPHVSRLRLEIARRRAHR